MGAGRLGKGLRGRAGDPSGDVLMNPQAVEDRTAGRMYQRLQLGLRGKKEELGLWEKKMKAARTPHQSNTSKRKERDSKHLRRELKEILGLRPSLCSMLLCVLGVGVS